MRVQHDSPASSLPQQSEAERNKEIVRRHILESWNQGSTETVAETLANEFHLHDPVFPNLPPGAQSARNHIQACRRAFPDLTLTIGDTIAEGNEVVVHWSARGTHKGDFLGMHPTNRPATITGTSIYHLEGNRIVEEWAHWNLMTMIEQLGPSQQQQSSAPASSARKPSARSLPKGNSRPHSRSTRSSRP